MTAWLLENALVAAALCVPVAVACRLLRRRPAVCHLLWLLVMLRLVAPPTPLSALPELSVGTLIEHAAAGAGGLVAGAARVSAPAESDPWGKPTRGPTTLDSAPLLDDGAAARPERAVPAALDLAALSRATLALWALGALVVLGHHLRQVLRVRARVARSQPAPAQLVATVARVAARLGVRPPDVRLLPGTGSPAVWCLGPSILLWPADDLRPGDGHLLAAHELAHLKRRDHWVAWLEVLLSSVCWWNPVLWYVRPRVRRYAEQACDAWAVWAFPDRRRAYAEALIVVAEGLSSSVRAAPVMAVASDEPRDLQRRLTMIMKDPVTRGTPPFVAAAAVLATALLFPSLSRASDETARQPIDLTVDASLMPPIAKAIDLHLALASLEVEDWEGAVGHLEHVLAAQPDSPKLWGKLGQALVQLGRWDAATTAFERQLDAGLAVPDAYAGLARVAAGRGDATTARVQLEHAVACGFHDAETIEELGGHDDLLATVNAVGKLWNAAKAAVAEKDWSQALASYQALVERQPDNGQALHMLGYALIGAGEPQQALSAFGRQLELGHNPAVGHYNAACACSLMHQTAAAWEHLTAALAAGFSDWHLLRTDGDLDALEAEPRFATLRQDVLAVERQDRAFELAMETDDPQGALAALDQLAALDPAQPGLARRRGEACMASGQPALAAEALAAAVRGDPIDEVPGLLHELARAECASGRDARALAYLELAIDAGWHGDALADDAVFAQLAHDPRFELVLQRLDDRKVLARFGAASWEGLQRINAERVAADPQDGMAWHRLGWAAMRSGDLEAAVKAFTYQDESGLNTGTARYNLACCHALLGDREAAFHWLAAAVDAGAIDAEHMQHDADLASLHGDGRFATLVATAKAQYGDKQKAKGEKQKQKEWADHGTQASPKPLKASKAKETAKSW